MISPDVKKLAEDIETSRLEIEKLQERVRQLVARRGKRAELVKSNGILAEPSLPADPQVKVNGSIRRRSGSAKADAPPGLEKELNLDEGFVALKDTKMSEVRLIAFKHGAVVLLFADDRSISVRMDERGPKPLFDLLTANDSKFKVVQANGAEAPSHAAGL